MLRPLSSPLPLSPSQRLVCHFGLRWCFAILAILRFAEVPTEAQQPPSDFPTTWLGTWQGTVKTDSPFQPPFDMELTIQPTDDPDRFQWKMVYHGEAGESIRPYHLVVVNRERGVFAIDEGEGIELDARYFEGNLHSIFRAGTNLIAVTYRLETSPSLEPALHFQLQSFEPGAKKEDGMTLFESLSINGLQHALLKRKKSSDPDQAQAASWRKLPTEPYPGKQDDLVMLDLQTGWYANGAGKIFHTSDGGEHWTLQLHQPGTFFRCVAFVNPQLGFAGNIGPGYFPNVSDSVPLYRTQDGGKSWAPVKIDHPSLVGLCAMQVLERPFINAGNLDSKPRILAAGRVGGPAAFIYSDDLGDSWQTIELPSEAQMILDLHFVDAKTGWLAAATDTEVSQSHGLILMTEDGGQKWTEVYRSSRPYELMWKMAFPSPKVAFATLQSYNPDPSASQRFIVKSVDGGRTWSEIPLVDDSKVREFGVGFASEDLGWVGAAPNGFETRDGGLSWNPIDFGNAVNKIRILKHPGGISGFAIGSQVHRIDLPVGK